MDSSKPRGILASLEHKAAEPPRRPALSAPSAARSAFLVVGGGIMVSAVLAWWLYSGPSPLMVDGVSPPPPAFSQAAPASEPAPRTDNEAAAIVDEAPAPSSAPSPALAAVLAPTPIATVVMHRERVAARAHPRPKPKPKQVPARREQPRSPPRAAPDTDVALLSAIVAHAGEHDVVEARAGDSTASLLQRCRRVGGEEGRLCGLRICATRAGDQACHVE